MPDSRISTQKVKHELYTSTERFHIIASWVGLVFNIVWFVNDYFIMNDHLVPFLLFRIGVSSVSAIVLIFRKQLKANLFLIMFILVAGISIQNSYMWSVMDLEHFQKHTFAYIVLFIGVGMLVLWEIYYSFLLIVVTAVSNVVFHLLFSQYSLTDFFVNGGLITWSVAIFSFFLIRSRYRLTFNEIKIRMALAESKKIIEEKHAEVLEQKIEIENQKDALENKNREITDSINYAKNIQRALLPSEEKFNSFFKDSFVLFKPKDIVSGDYFWIYNEDDYVFYVTADCTGHGVPGGFMTMLGLSFLEDIIVRQNILSPEIILDKMRDRIINALNQSGSVSKNKDGMDIAICRFNRKNKQLLFSLANNNLYLIRKEQLEIVKADRQPCGQHVINKPFTLHELQLEEGDAIYTFTDGYADQFGGPEGKKFRYKQFESLLISNSNLPFEEQKNILNQTIEQWKGTGHEQIDDILVIGVGI